MSKHTDDMAAVLGAIRELNLQPVSRKKRLVTETDVERAFCARVKTNGGTAYKFTSPARRSVPDRLVLRGVLPMIPVLREVIGRAVDDVADDVLAEACSKLLRQAVSFCELKAPGKKPTPEQQREHARLRDLGFTVDVIDNLEAAKTWQP
jgi:hypothetical protein